MDFSHFFQTNYWLGVSPSPLGHTSLVIFLLFFGTFVVAHLFLKIFSFFLRKRIEKPHKRLISKIMSLLFTMGSIGLVWTFFAWQAIPVVAGRWLLLGWTGSLLVWIYLIMRYVELEMPLEIKELQYKRELGRYLP